MRRTGVFIHRHPGSGLSIPVGMQNIHFPVTDQAVSAARIIAVQLRPGIAVDDHTAVFAVRSASDQAPDCIRRCDISFCVRIDH